MIDSANVYAALSSYADIQSLPASDVMPVCQKGLDWVNSRLRDGVDPDHPLITETAAAMAHYFFFLYRLTDSDKYESCKLGDVTYKRDITKEFEFETKMKNQALADAAEILEDGGFYCRGR